MFLRIFPAWNFHKVFTEKKLRECVRVCMCEPQECGKETKKTALEIVLCVFSEKWGAWMDEKAFPVMEKINCELMLCGWFFPLLCHYVRLSVGVAAAAVWVIVRAHPCLKGIFLLPIHRNIFSSSFAKTFFSPSELFTEKKKIFLLC